MKTAQAVLEAAKKASGAAKVASPEVLGLESELEAEKVSLKTAESFLDDLRKANKGVEKATKVLADAASGFKIEKLGVKGSLLGITSGGEKGDSPKLLADVEIGKKLHHYSVELNPGKAFNQVAKEIAKQVAKELVDVFG